MGDARRLVLQHGAGHLELPLASRAKQEADLAGRISCTLVRLPQFRRTMLRAPL